MPKILISYRRSDTAGIAGRIFDRLVARFGHESIFMDVDHIPFGTDFRGHIRQTLLTSDMLLAIVGSRWLGPREGGRARMHDENDPVRVEIETALEHGVTVIPVLVDGAPMPEPHEMPGTLERFAFLNAAPVDSGRDFHLHMDRLIRTIEQHDGATEKQPPAAATAAATDAPSAPWSRPAQTSASQFGKWLTAGAIAVVAIAAGVASYVGFLGAPTLKSPAPATTEVVPASGPPLRIGTAVVQSGIGAAQGKEILLAMKIWQEDVNLRGGLLGRPVEIIAHDDEGKPSNIEGLYARLIDIDKVDFVVSGWPTYLIKKAMPAVAQRNKLFLGLLGLEANGELNYPRYFSIMPVGPTRRSVLTRGLFELAGWQNPKPRTVAIAASEDFVCDEVAAGAREQAKAERMPIVYDEAFAFSTTDFAPIVRAMAAKNAELVVCIFGGYATNFVQAVDRENFRPKMIGGAMQSLRAAEVKAQLGPLLNGWINFEFWLPAPRLQFTGASAVLSRYQSRAGDEGAEPLGHQLAMWSYARMQVLQQAVEATRSLDDNRLAEHIRHATFKTVVGDVRFGDRGEWAQPRILQVQFQNIRNNDIEQFRDLRTQAVVYPLGYSSGNLIYPFADARK